jgi:hypothetical protein
MGWDIKGDYIDIWKRLRNLKKEHVALQRVCLTVAIVSMICAIVMKSEDYRPMCLKITSSMMIVYIAVKALDISTRNIRMTVIDDNNTIDTKSRLSTTLSFVGNYLMMVARLLILCLIMYLMISIAMLFISVHTHKNWTCEREELVVFGVSLYYFWLVCRVICAIFEIPTSLGFIFKHSIVHDTMYRVKKDERTRALVALPSPIMLEIENLVVPGNILQLVNLSDPKLLMLHIFTIVGCTAGSVFYGLFGIYKRNMTETEIQDRFVEGLNVFTFIMIFVYLLAIFCLKR